jgi:hypothetical protein
MERFSQCDPPSKKMADEYRDESIVNCEMETSCIPSVKSFLKANGNGILRLWVLVEKDHLVSSGS